jgi:uncharacterized protein (UPF0332 family)
MTTDVAIQAFLTKALESLAAADRDFEEYRYNSCANRCYYACFQAAIAALMRAGIGTLRRDGRWSHAFVQAQFAALITRRKLYPPSLRDTLVRLLALRETADYRIDHVNQTQAARALRRAQEFVGAVQRGGDP